MWNNPYSNDSWCGDDCKHYVFSQQYGSTTKNSFQQHEDTGAQVFRKIILSWTINDIVRERQSLPRLPNKLERYEINDYYKNFLPLILEETRAILAQDLKNKKTQSFDVTVIELKPIGRNPTNPANLKLKGRLPKNTDEGMAWIVLQLAYYNINIRRDTTILCLADVRKNDTLLAKIALNSDNNYYDKFISSFRTTNPNAFQIGSKWKACVLGSVLSQMRIYDVCYNAPQPKFIQDVITGESLSLIRHAVRRFPKFDVSQKQAVQDFNKHNAAHQKAIIKFLAFPSTCKILLLKFFTLDELEKQKIQRFLSFSSLEQQFIRALYSLKNKEQQNIHAFSTLCPTPTNQQTIKYFYKFEPSERKAIFTFDLWPIPNKLAIQRFYELNTAKQDAIKKFNSLSVIEKDAAHAFHVLSLSEQEAIKIFYKLEDELQTVLQKSSSFLPYIWQYIAGKSWYEKKISHLRSTLANIQREFTFQQQRTIEIFSEISQTKKENIYKIFAPNFLHKQAINEFLDFSPTQREAVKTFYMLPKRSQLAVAKFSSLNQTTQNNIKTFYKLNPMEQIVVDYLYMLSIEQQGSIQVISKVDYSTQSEIKDFFASDTTTLKAMRDFDVLPNTLQANICCFLRLNDDAQKAIQHFYPLTTQEKIAYYELCTLNPSQQTAVRNFCGLTQGIQLLQGPPGTGKTTTIIKLLNFLCAQNKRVLVCAPSNKAVQVIAERFFKKYPAHRSILIGVEEKLKPSLRSIFIHTWGGKYM